jgi:hypothetical protein
MPITAHSARIAGLALAISLWQMFFSSPVLLGGPTANPATHSSSDSGLTLFVFVEVEELPVLQIEASLRKLRRVVDGQPLFSHIIDLRSLGSSLTSQSVIDNVVSWFMGDVNTRQLTPAARMLLEELRKGFPEPKGLLYLQTLKGTNTESMVVKYYPALPDSTGGESARRTPRIYYMQMDNDRQGFQSILAKCFPESNHAPVLRLTIDGSKDSPENRTYRCNVGESLEFDARGSYDQESPQDRLDFVWRQVSTPFGWSDSAVTARMRGRSICRLNFTSEGTYTIGVRAYDGSTFSPEETIAVRVVRLRKLALVPPALRLYRQGSICSPKTIALEETLAVAIGHDEQHSLVVHLAPRSPMAVDEEMNLESLPALGLDTAFFIVKGRIHPGATEFAFSARTGSENFDTTTLDIRYDQKSAIDLLLEGEINNAPPFSLGSTDEHRDLFTVSFGARLFVTEFFSIESKMAVFHPHRKIATPKPSIRASCWLPGLSSIGAHLSCIERQIDIDLSNDAWRLGVGVGARLPLSEGVNLEIGAEAYPVTAISGARVFLVAGASYDIRSR